jgi:8-oxoguanine deaminase
MVAGRWRVLDGQIADLDVPRLIAHHSEAARSLLARQV